MKNKLAVIGQKSLAAPSMRTCVTMGFAPGAGAFNTRTLARRASFTSHARSSILSFGGRVHSSAAYRLSMLWSRKAAKACS